MVKKSSVKVGKIQFHLISPITIYISQRGLGDRDSKMEADFINRRFLQPVYISIITEKLTQFKRFVYIAQITILKVGNNSLSFFDKKLSNHLIMRKKFCIIE